jgi:hypothetical protein
MELIEIDNPATGETTEREKKRRKKSKFGTRGQLSPGGKQKD